MALELNGTTGVSLVQDGVLTDANMPAGSVVQVISGQLSTQVAVSSSSYTDIGLSATITPSSTSNRIFVIATVNLFLNNNNDTSGAGGWSIRDGSNTVLVYSQGDTTPFDLGFYGGSWFNIQGVQTRQFVHSPNTTSAYTYKVSGQCGYANNITFNYTNNTNYAPVSYITLMEIAA